jgi:hypothetical protein
MLQILNLNCIKLEQLTISDNFVRHDWCKTIQDSITQPTNWFVNLKQLTYEIRGVINITSPKGRLEIIKRKIPHIDIMFVYMDQTGCVDECGVKVLQRVEMCIELREFTPHTPHIIESKKRRCVVC